MKNGKVNIFDGNINDLIATLSEKKDIDYTEQRYLNFASLPDRKTALDKLAMGCPAMFEKYLKTAEKVQVQTYSGKEYQMADEGIFFDIPTMLTGEPDYWINEADTTIPTAPKEIIINTSAPYWVKETDIFNKLIKIVEFIDVTEATGQRLAVKVLIAAEKGKASKGSKDNRKYTFTVEIKQANEPINIQQLVYLIASPILLRYACLTLQHRYGIEYNPMSDEKVEIEYMANADSIYIPSITYDFLNDICCHSSKNFSYETLNISEAYNIRLA